MASRGVNKVILVGNLGNDPEIRYMPNGGAVANITVATSESLGAIKRQVSNAKKQNGTVWLCFGKVGGSRW